VSERVLELRAVRKSYGVGSAVETEVLHGVDLSLNHGEFAALIGPSGSGKTTLLNLLGLLDRPSSGELLLLGQPTRALDDESRTRMRGRGIGFVFQFHHLISAFSALENVLMPEMIASGRPSPAQRADAMALLDAVGLAAHVHKLPGELSGGQQQRVAIVRALISRPALLLADEPTGNLDTQTADQVFALFRQFNRERNLAVLVVTHDPRLADRCDRVIQLVDGRIVRDEAQAKPQSA